MWCAVVILVNLLAFKLIEDFFDFIPVGAFSLVLLLLAYLPTRRLKQICYDDNFVYVSSFWSEDRFLLNKVKGVNIPSLLSFYAFELEIQSGDAVIKFNFWMPMPHMTQYFSTNQHPSLLKNFLLHVKNQPSKT
jgi:hypothetical protein